MNASDARQFLISRVLEEAGVEQVDLSEVEKKMLQFTEVHPSLPDIHEINAQFERERNADEYEAKIAGLLKNARERDSLSSPPREQEWKDALDVLKHEDHYILVMAGRAFGSFQGGHRNRRLLLSIVVGIGVVLFIVPEVLRDVRR